MSENSKIQWCDDTHNFWRGCVKVSPGCANCYAEVSTPVRVARSEGRELWGGTLRDRAKDFDAPLRWNQKPWVCDECGKATAKGIDEEPHKCNFGPAVHQSFHRRRVFSLSLGDWLDGAVPIEWLADMLDVIRRCPNLDFLLLTKRPENWFKRLVAVAQTLPLHGHGEWVRDWLEAQLPNGGLGGKAPTNVWIGTTVENQEYADKRIPKLLEIPAVCRFISYEPALGPVDFRRIPRDYEGDEKTRINFDALDGQWEEGFGYVSERIHWVIVGGESGPKARPFNVEWARSTVAQCRAAGVACFVKQMGAKPCEELVYTPSDAKVPEIATHFKRFKDKKGGDMAEWSEDLRVREFPEVRR